MDKSYEKHTRELYKSDLVPFIANRVAISKNTVPWLHWHENIEFLRCCSGHGQAISGGTRFAFDTDDIISINSGSPHAFTCSGAEPLRYAYVIVDVEFLKSNGIDPEEVKYSSHIHDQKASELFDRAFESFSSDSEFSVLKSRTAMLDFLNYITEKHLSTPDELQNPSSIDEIKKAVNYIRNNYNKDISLQSAASVAGYSVCYFSRKFKKITGQTFITFLNSVRCENAANMLKNGAKVADVCFDCGFNEPSYFSRTFKSLMGYAPSETKK